MGDGEKFWETRANARLIAAAPDLLEACQETLTKLEHLNGEGIVQMPRTIAVLSAAIKKARGE